VRFRITVFEEEESAAKAAGLRYFHIPFNAASPDPSAVDHWDKDRAEKEAAALGMNSATLKEFAVTYAQTHKLFQAER
jgi:protein tyrosine phosphatase (PTP) superfamily phosphohydrolase (DUF442 family)